MPRSSRSCASIARPAGRSTEAVSAALAKKIEPALEGCDAVLLSDYGSGLVTPALAGTIRRALSRRARRRPIPVLLDSRYRLLDYRGLTACTPNESEVEQVLGIRIDDDAEALERAGRLLLRRTRMQAVLITRGSRGMALFEPRQPTVHIPIFGSDEVTDVTGAGDTVIATFGLALAAGASFYEAARLANYAGGLVVMKRGTATVSAAGAGRRGDERSRHVARELVAGRTGAGTSTESGIRDLGIGNRGDVGVASWSTRSRAIARRGARSRSPTAASICCTSATCATSRARRPKPIA